MVVEPVVMPTGAERKLMYTGIACVDRDAPVVGSTPVTTREYAPEVAFVASIVMLVCPPAVDETARVDGKHVGTVAPEGAPTMVNVHCSVRGLPAAVANRKIEVAATVTVTWGRTGSESLVNPWLNVTGRFEDSARLKSWTVSENVAVAVARLISVTVIV